MKIYTRTGDDGSTGLYGGTRVRKSDPRIECYGTVDELNATLGLAGAVAAPLLQKLIVNVQNELFVVGAELATPSGDNPPARMTPISQACITRLEAEIDSAEVELLPLHNFILPGGCEAAGRLHVSRTICRRAERLIVALATHEEVDPLVITYLNRLSDWLFVQARWSNHAAGVTDVPWKAM